MFAALESESVSRRTTAVSQVQIAAGTGEESTATTITPGRQTSHTPSSGPRRGKAPPVDSFTGEDVAVQLEDWLPSLERVARWNGWSPEDQLLQFAGHLRGRALQEWNCWLCHCC